ncbi:hypothetical protein NMY22_g12397 [Coprinellus aureogranulatus]|nr:hypothetical protein NMY22_g12397 [Coprinellus aureogranulatus]
MLLTRQGSMGPESPPVARRPTPTERLATSVDFDVRNSSPTPALGLLHVPKDVETRAAGSRRDSQTRQEAPLERRVQIPMLAFQTLPSDHPRTFSLLCSSYYQGPPTNWQGSVKTGRFTPSSRPKRSTDDHSQTTVERLRGKGGLHGAQSQSDNGDGARIDATCSLEPKWLQLTRGYLAFNVSAQLASSFLTPSSHPSGTSSSQPPSFFRPTFLFQCLLLLCFSFSIHRFETMSNARISSRLRSSTNELQALFARSTTYALGKAPQAPACHITKARRSIITLQREVLRQRGCWKGGDDGGQVKRAEEVASGSQIKTRWIPKQHSTLVLAVGLMCFNEGVICELDFRLGLLGTSTQASLSLHPRVVAVNQVGVETSVEKDLGWPTIMLWSCSSSAGLHVHRKASNLECIPVFMPPNTLRPCNNDVLGAESAQASVHLGFGGRSNSVLAGVPSVAVQPQTPDVAC